MSPRIIKSLARFTAAVSVASAAALTASALSASASAPQFQLFGTSGNQTFPCAPGTYGVQQLLLFGETAATNQCGTRVWLHQFSNGSGWSYCVSPRTAVLIPSWAEFAAQLLVSKNTAHC